MSLCLIVELEVRTSDLQMHVKINLQNSRKCTEAGIGKDGQLPWTPDIEFEYQNPNDTKYGPRWFDFIHRD